ncbi:MAG: spore germination protein, partial [Clostridiaceae bacterium]|nr:spore germination protein [Clostridiaceae bacterium]
TINSAIEKTPLPLGAEIFFLGTMFELLRESGTRLPKAVGPAISIVGALIIGEAAVNAGIVSAPVVIVVALTAVCSFVNSSLNEFMMVYRYIFLFAGGTMGLIGIASVTMIMLSQIASSDSFGGSTLSTYTREDIRDNPLRLPLWSMKFRPSSIAGENKRRQK